MHVEALLRCGLPFVETRLAEGDAFGAGLEAGLAGGVQVNDVGHFLFTPETLLASRLQSSMRASKSIHFAETQCPAISLPMTSYTPDETSSISKHHSGKSGNVFLMA